MPVLKRVRGQSLKWVMRDMETIWERLLEESDRKDSWLYKHLDALENDNARIEACHDVIKMCKRISTELQKGV